MPTLSDFSEFCIHAISSFLHELWGGNIVYSESKCRSVVINANILWWLWFTIIFCTESVVQWYQRSRKSFLLVIVWKSVHNFAPNSQIVPIQCFSMVRSTLSFVEENKVHDILDNWWGKGAKFVLQIQPILKSWRRLRGTLSHMIWKSWFGTYGRCKFYSFFLDWGLLVLYWHHPIWKSISWGQNGEFYYKY